MMEATFVIVGGGIAGVTCAETLAFLEPEEKILLISESSVIKTVTNLLAITQTLSQFNVEEKEATTLTKKFPNIQILHDKLSSVDGIQKLIKTQKGQEVKYEYLCICTGAQPKLIPQSQDNPYVLGIRDTDSVVKFLERLSLSKKVVLVGNGGIASELAYKIKKAQVEWVIKDKHITSTFVDPGAAEFFRPILENRDGDKEIVSKRMRYEEAEHWKSGAALGPDWYKHLEIKGALTDGTPPAVTVHYGVEITEVKITNEEFPLKVTLTNGEEIPCDLIVSATGVTPQTDFTFSPALGKSPEGGLIIDEFMQTSCEGIYAAGDVAHPNWNFALHWFPMKLWTQARQMGCYAAKSMAGHRKKESVLQDFCFELFTHTTRLFGFKVVLLGLYNGQKLGTDYEVLFRMTRGLEFVKFVLKDGKLQGAVLIGETDLEETCENLILNQIDLSEYKEDLLNPDIDIEDYFD